MRSFAVIFDNEIAVVFMAGEIMFRPTDEEWGRPVFGTGLKG
jgi:hypothetical protein